MVAKLKIQKTQPAASPDGFVDSGFDNPIGSSNTYGVVGGATGQTGQQILARVAIPKPATGTIYSTTGSTTGYGMVTGLTDISTNSALGSSDGLDIGKVSAVNSGILLYVTNAVSTGSFLVTSGNVSTTGGVNTPVWFDETFNQITVNSPYFIKSIANSTHFTVSLTPGGAAVPVTTENGLSANLNQASVTFSSGAAQTLSNAPFVVADNAAGYVLRQKGKRKYLVADATAIQDEDIKAGLDYRIVTASGTDWSQFGAGPDATSGKIFTATINGSSAVVDNGVVNLVGVCKTANLANTALTVSTMNLQATKDPSGTVYLDSLTSKQAIDFSAAATPGENAGTHYYASTNGAVAADTTNGINYMVVDVRTA